jgi:hypothetical protein
VAQGICRQVVLVIDGALWLFARSAQAEKPAARTGHPRAGNLLTARPGALQ